MTRVTERDICEATNELGPYELRHLFHNLGMSDSDIEHAERSADTYDTRLQARAVLRLWKKINGRVATREALLEARRNLSSTREIEG